jgi:ribonuclease HII
MLPFSSPDIIEIGVDEAGRGCLFGRVYIGGVILPQNIIELCENEKVILKDSKKLSKKKRDKARQFIEKYAIEYSVKYKEHYEIDQINILQATLTGMHDIIDSLTNKPDKILVDGNHFIPYENIPHECVINGDNTYMNIAAASILAKTYRDEYIDKLCTDNIFFKKYDLQRNMGYGTARHINAIKEYGITPFHRISFGICKSAPLFKFNKEEKEDIHII